MLASVSSLGPTPTCDELVVDSLGIVELLRLLCAGVVALRGICFALCVSFTRYADSLVREHCAAMVLHSSYNTL